MSSLNRSGAAFDFRTSSYSEELSNCVEVATNVRDVVALRDSKNPGLGTLLVRPAAWRTFTGRVKDGAL